MLVVRTSTSATIQKLPVAETCFLWLIFQLPPVVFRNLKRTWTLPWNLRHLASTSCSFFPRSSLLCHQHNGWESPKSQSENMENCSLFKGFTLTSWYYNLKYISYRFNFNYRKLMFKSNSLCWSCFGAEFFSHEISAEQCTCTFRKFVLSD